MGEVYATVTIYPFRRGWATRIYFFFREGGQEKGFGMMVYSFCAAIMSARSIDLCSYALNDLLAVAWTVKNGKEKEKSVRKAIPMAGQSSQVTCGQGIL